MKQAVMYDSTTKKWFEKHLFVETTVVQCESCGLFYKPSLGRKCRIGGNNESTNIK